MGRRGGGISGDERRGGAQEGRGVRGWAGMMRQTRAVWRGWNGARLDPMIAAPMAWGGGWGGGEIGVRRGDDVGAETVAEPCRCGRLHYTHK
jgi:hypothetical protein